MTRRVGETIEEILRADMAVEEEAIPLLRDAIQHCEAVRDFVSRDLFARILAFEQAGPRVLLRGEHWTAFVPFAARWPIEVHLLPHRQVPDFAGLTDAERDVAPAEPAEEQRQQREGGSWHVQVSLAQTGHWLRGMGRVPDGLRAARPALAPYVERSASGFGALDAVTPSAQLERTPVHSARIISASDRWP